MHKGFFETEKFTIIYITKCKPTRFISVDECIKIISDIKLNLANFKALGDMYFPKYKLEYTKNILMSIEVISNKKHNSKSVCNVLKRLFPTVFDSKIIANLNIKIFLCENRERLLSMCHTILGPSCKPIVDSLTTLDQSCSVEIIEDELIVDDIIDNEHFQMHLKQ